METINAINIIKGNRVFGEFMEWEKCFYSPSKVTNPHHPLYKKKIEPIEVFCLCDTHVLVESLYTDCCGYHWNYDKEDENYNTIFYGKWSDDDNVNTKLDALWLICLDFIKWYNNHKIN